MKFKLIRYLSLVISLLIILFAVIFLLIGFYGKNKKSIVLQTNINKQIGYISNAVVLENNKNGTKDWILKKPSEHQIEGYASTTSASLGDTINFYVNTNSPYFNADIYRMGYYRDNGAILVKTIHNIKGESYPPPNADSQTGLVDENWLKSFSLQVPKDWLSGIYMVKLTASNGFQNYIPIVIRQPDRKSDIIFIRGVATDQAYNVWGGASLYGGPAAHNLSNSRATKVSYNRPFVQDFGAGQFFWWEYPMVRFLEKNGYDISYITDIDEHEHPEWLLNHKAIVITGHDEYWTKEMRDGIENAIKYGVSLANFAANTSFWQIRLEPSSQNGILKDRIQVGYKTDAHDKVHVSDPISDNDESLVTTQWRNPPVNRPEQSFLGAMYQDVVRYQGPFPWVVKNADNWVFDGTSLKSGDQIPDLVGYEYDRVFSEYPTPPNLVILSDSPVRQGNDPKDRSQSNSVIYQTTNKSWVFDAGTVQWSWGLDDYLPPFSAPQPPYLKKTMLRKYIVNKNIQIITQNILNKFISDN